MGSVLKAIGSIVGIGGGAPKVDTSGASSEVDSAATKAQQARAALLETAGGGAGSPLQPGQVTNTRDTLLGN